MIAGEGKADRAALLILRALAGNAGKVEIGGRRYTFSCIPAFRLEDDESGQVHDCVDSGALLRTILFLVGGAGATTGAHPWCS
ncbi:MAG TPA: hypothetical protein VGK94_04500 [Candidatus Polarisedimenticolia bacterium]|jgi:hypothetical protein